MSDDHEKYYRAEWMTDDQWRCWQMVADLMGGFHHVDDDKVKSCGRGIVWTTSLGRWATFDFSGLTRAVIMAHDRAIRLEINPCNMQRVSVTLHTRKRDGMIHERHPTMEAAMIAHRG